ncbi:MAG TPA: hypothetical protein VGM03_23900 [Phycisphaerae bacterium]|jgi:hypothetical protein
MNRHQIALFGSLGAAILATPQARDARAQCQPQWLSGDGIPGVYGYVKALTTWDPDGNGPQPPMLVIGGKFTIAGNAVATNVAAWDGSGWLNFGNGIPGSGAWDAVLALASFDDGSGPKLLAGGNFTIANGAPANYIAQWTGAQWVHVGNSTNGTVSALTVVDLGSGPALYVAGGFTTAGGVSANRIAKWDGTAWSPLGAGLSGGADALTVFNDGSGPALYIGGAFTSAGGAPANRVARWDGSNWSAVGEGFSNSEVLSLTVFDDGSGPALFAGGSFWMMGGATLNHIAKWTGTKWVNLGTGVDGAVSALAVFDDGSGPDLYAAGSFYSAGGAWANRIAKWNGATWSSLGSGLGDFASALAVFDDGSGAKLVVGGYFDAAGGVGASRLAKWNGMSWSQVGTGMAGTSPSVEALVAFSDASGPALYVGGGFLSAGSTPAAHVAKWSGTDWSQLGSGLNGTVDALASFDDGIGPRLYAGGAFTSAGGAPAKHIAVWDGASWQPLGGGIDLLEEHVANVFALTTFSAELLAGGRFSVAGDVEAFNIARWNGTSWSAVGAGVPGQAWVSALAVFDDGGGPALYAGGSFANAGEVAAANIARWDGAQWSPVGAGVNGLVSALAVFDDGSGPALYAGGEFTSAGGAAAGCIAKWDGVTWSSLGPGVNSSVRALAVWNDGGGPALYVGGSFTMAGAGPASYLAKWSGAGWSAIGSGLGGVVEALTSFDEGAGGLLYVGGWFNTAGGSISARWARWGCLSNAPLVTIASTNPPAVSPYGGGVFRDVLQDTTRTYVPQGIGVAGTPSEGPYNYYAISVTLSGTPSLTPTPANASVTCTDISSWFDCPQITGMSGSGPGPYLISLSNPTPAGECITFTFPGTSAGQKLQYQVLPGDVNLDGQVSTQDILTLIQRINDGTASLPANRARYNINRSNETGGVVVTTQDLLRLVQLFNGTNATQPFAGATVADCP